MECNGKRTPRGPSHHPILTVCEVFRVGATGKENKNTTSCARDAVGWMVGEKTMRLRWVEMVGGDWTASSSGSGW